MTGPLLETKLYAPRARRGLVPRSRLNERLDRGAELKLTLISAPAGFGKSTLLADWLAATRPDRRTAWLSLDQRDSSPAAFWSYVIAALQTAVPGVGAGALSLLESPQPAIDAALGSLLNELSAVSDEVVLVLDDYHLVDAPEVHDAMAFLLDHLPHQVHVVIATRADPGLPLARLRGRGDLTEIRAADLRFTPDEAATYLNEVMGLELSAPDIAALEGRTEGWIAALQLAALSIQGRSDAAGFIAAFAGDDRYIVDYLVEEVLQRQPETVRTFLLHTSILSRLTGPLADAVTGQDGGRATLEALDRGNLFLVPLDDRRSWYRYHHLFADVLRARLLDEQPASIPELHRRASDWYEANGERPEAIRHAMAGGHMERAADLIELAIPATTQARQEAMRRDWLEGLPDAVIRRRPVLSNAYAGSLLIRGKVEGVEERLRDAERGLVGATSAGTGAAPQAASMGADLDAFRDLRGSIAIHRAGLALLQGDLAGTVAHARRALEVIRGDDLIGRGAAAALVGLANWASADLDAASRGYAAAMADFETAGYLSDVLGCTIAAADIRMAQGRLTEAMRLYERGLQLATGEGLVPLRGAADMHVGMADVLRERNHLDEALRHLRQSADLGEANGLPQNAYRSRVALARVRQAVGDDDAALELLAEAEARYFSDFSPKVRPVAAIRARAWIAQGRLAEARGWARERGLSAADELSYVREFEHLTLARLVLAEAARDRADHRIAEALGILERLLRAADEGGRAGSVIEILLVQALAHHAAGDAAASLRSLEQAILLLEPEGYVRIVIDEGPPMASLLRLAAKQRDALGGVRRLLDAMDGVTPEPQAPAGELLIEPLSERELEVLRLLSSELDGPEIARELVVSLNTVRTHTKNIYAKLGVNGRRAAVRRAEELNLLTRTRDR